MNLPLYQLLANDKSKEAIACLTELALKDSQRSSAFGITPENARSQIQTRLDLFHTVYSDFATLCETLQLSPFPIESLWHLWLPLALQIAQWRKAKNQPLIQGFLGGQGTGKTTLTAILTLILKHIGYESVSLSLDDLYLPYVDRIELQKRDPRLVRRGPPGTHDLALGLQILQQFQQNQFPIELPRFDKSAYSGAGDRMLPERIERADILLFEGWFVGVRPIDATHFEQAPRFSVFKTEEDLQFARDMNDLLHDYLPLWQVLDRLIVLYVPDYRLSQQWRKQAEHKMKAEGKAGMTDAEIDAFVEYFWKALHPELFIKPLVYAPDWVDLIIEINSDRSPGAVYLPLGAKH